MVSLGRTGLLGLGFLLAGLALVAVESLILAAGLALVVVGIGMLVYGVLVAPLRRLMPM